MLLLLSGPFPLGYFDLDRGTIWTMVVDEHGDICRESPWIGAIEVRQLPSGSFTISLCHLVLEKTLASLRPKTHPCPVAPKIWQGEMMIKNWISIFSDKPNWLRKRRDDL